MKYAETINDIINAFNLYPLSEKDLPYFYEDTMEYRTGDEYESPIQDIIDACKIPSERNSFLLLGHKGCGKSTELNNMSVKLKNEGYSVYTVECDKDLDLPNALHTDLMILMGEALIEIADNINCRLNKDIINQVNSFWDTSIEKVVTIDKSNSTSAEAGIQAGNPLFSILNLFANFKADLKFNEENREVHRTKIRQRSSEWLLMLRKISNIISEKLSGKQPIIIFEDLDKLDSKTAWDIFGNYSSLLTRVSFPVIYTFPIALSYDTRFSALNGYFKEHTLPMIKQETVDGEPYKKGINTIVEIIKKRADYSLFEENAIEGMIKKTGGSLRDLFAIINDSAQRAIRRESSVITLEDAKIALEKHKSSLTRRIERRHYEFLADIYRGNRELIENKEMLLEMLQANAVLEYNGKRWHNLHPLVAEFLKEQGLT